MNRPSGDDDQPAEPMDEVREAASAVVSSLWRLLEATETLIADPAAFDRAVAGGKGIIDAFASGFIADPQPSGSPATDPVDNNDGAL